MIKATWRDYHELNDNLDVLFDEGYKTNKTAKTPHWLTVYLTAEGKPALFWIRKYHKHKEELQELYPEYDFEEVDKEKKAAHKAWLKKMYPNLEDLLNGSTK